MDTSKPVSHNVLRGAAALATLLAVASLPRTASAGPNLYFQGGPTRNLIIDVVFWGTNFTDSERADVRDYIVKFTRYMNGGFNPAGKEPVARFYGLWGVLPGNWINDTRQVPPDTMAGQPRSLTDQEFMIEIDAAHDGTLGASQDFAGNVLGAGLPNGTNRLAVIFVKGTNDLADQACDNGFQGPCVDPAFHSYNEGHNYPFAAVRFDSPSGTVLSHEILEALTDTHPWQGWVTNQDQGFKIREGADECGGDGTLNWVASTGDDISGISDFTLNASYGGMETLPTDTCQIWERQQYTPMAATYEACGQSGSSRCLTVVYRTPLGQLREITWPPGANASPPVDLGQLYPGITAEGQPSVVYGLFGGGEWLFTRGSDDGLWVRNNGIWQHLGGAMFGDPSAVMWGNGTKVNAFVLGADERIWTYGFANGSALGWSQIDSNAGHVFNSPPKAISRTSTTIDLFAIFENGHLQWMPFSSAGLSSLVSLGPLNTSLPAAPHLTPPAIASWSSTRLDVFTAAESAIGHRGYGGSWNSAWDIRTEFGTHPGGPPAAVSWGNNRIDIFNIDRSNRLNHVYWNGGWHGDSSNPLRTDAVGEPVVTSKASGQLDVVYRTTTGSLTHLSLNGTTWSTEANIVGAGSVQ